MNLTLLALPVLLLVVVLYYSWVRYWDKEEQEFRKRVHERTHDMLDKMRATKARIRMNTESKEESNS